MDPKSKERLREYYGHDVPEGDLEAADARLTRQLEALERLRAWEPELGLTEPAIVPRVVRTSQA